MNLPLAILGLIFIIIGLFIRLAEERCWNCGSTDLFTYSSKNVECINCGEKQIVIKGLTDEELKNINSYQAERR